ncbi:MAG TPA: ATP-binding protein, partial [Polyangia bacterium]
MAAKAFVGRHRELDELSSALAEVRAGQGALFIVVGGAGMGKTRFADEVTRAARAGGLQTAWGRCWETGGAPAYWPFMQVLRELVRGQGASLFETAAADAAADAAHARFRLFDAVTVVLREAAARAPLLVVLDDLHMADPSSLALLHFVARNLRGMPVLLLCTYRDEEARLRPEAGETLADIAREGTYLPLAPLSDDDVATLVEPLAGGTADRALIEE